MSHRERERNRTFELRTKSGLQNFFSAENTRTNRTKFYRRNRMTVFPSHDSKFVPRPNFNKFSFPKIIISNSNTSQSSRLSRDVLRCPYHVDFLPEKMGQNGNKFAILQPKTVHFLPEIKLLGLVGFFNTFFFFPRNQTKPSSLISGRKRTGVCCRKGQIFSILSHFFWYEIYVMRTSQDILGHHPLQPNSQFQFQISHSPHIFDKHFLHYK